MKIDVIRAAPLKRKSRCLVVGVFEKKLRQTSLKEIDAACHKGLSSAQKRGEFVGKQGQTLFLPAGNHLVPENVLLVGLGRDKTFDAVVGRKMVAKAASVVLEKRLDRFTLDLDSFGKRLSSERLGQAVAEGVLLANYRFDQFKTVGRDEAALPLSEIRLIARDSQVSEVATGVESGKKIFRGVLVARDLVNQPGNIKSPVYMAKQARQLAREVGMKCTILGQTELEKEGCGGILGVAQGSEREPQLIILEYNGGKKGAAPIALVGKGVVFDTGGISLKPSDKMDMMKMDMGGAAAVLGTLYAASLLELPVNLVGIVPAVENMPSGTAYRPGDVLTSLSGKTIEVLNTDAEGRLILADALTWAGRFNPELVIDLATLTGACIIALGNQAAAVLGNHDPLVQGLIKAGQDSGERVWQLPLFEEYDEQIKSPVADVANIGGRAAGTITAAAFLKKFAAEYNWAHLDIAGMAWEEKGMPMQPKGGTGFGVRLLIEYLQKR